MLIALLIVLVPAGVMLLPGAAHATNTITVNSATDSTKTSGNGFCTLREAINNANSPGVDTTGSDCTVGSGNDYINFNFSFPGTITLVAELPSIQNTLTIDGGTYGNVTIDGTGAYQILLAYSTSTLTLENLTLQNGSNTTGVGGAVSNGGTLTIYDCGFISNSAVFGGAISNQFNGTVTIGGSYFASNSASIDGGAILSDGPLSVVDSYFLDNSATVDGGDIDCSNLTTISECEFYGGIADEDGGSLYFVTGFATMDISEIDYASALAGGGIYNQAATLTVTNSTINGADALAGGGIYNEDDSNAVLTMINSAVYDNGALGEGGGIDNAGAGQVTITFSTIANNGASAGDDIYNAGGSMTVADSILALGSSANCAGTATPPTPPVTDGGYNISDDSSCDFTAATSVNSISPGLASGLGSNGGPGMLTVALVG
ncbi:MAG: CSLREA domain-containing protein, partial [Candidatus Binataceae bacterium]